MILYTCLQTIPALVFFELVNNEYQLTWWKIYLVVPAVIAIEKIIMGGVFELFWSKIWKK